MRLKISIIIFFGFLVHSVQAGNPDLFYYVSDGTNELYTINRNTGVTTLIGATGVSNIEAIAFYPVPGNNQLFAADAGNFGTLNIATGVFTLIGEIDGGGTANGAEGAQTLNDVDGLMLDGQTFKMWAIERNGGSDLDYLFQIDVTTGQFVRNAFGPGIDYLVITGQGIDIDCDDLAVDPNSGRIYATSNDNGNNDVLIEINKFTGTFSLTSTLSQDDVEGLAFSNDGILYGSEGDGDNRLGQINISTGVISNFFGFTGSDVEALASLVADANTVSGTVFEDDDLDGIKDGGETGLANVRVYLWLDNNSDGKVDPEDTRLQSTLTDVNGDYSFYFATTGDLLVSTSFSSYPATYALTTDNVETISFSDGVNFGEVDANNDFGLGTGPDCDSDGLPNFFEGSFDSDLDAITDSCDLDSDNDGIRDDVEGTEDFDDDGIPDYLDRDSDNDGIPDAIEANGGFAPSGYDASTGKVSGTDSDGNGIVDVLETSPGSGVMVASLPDSDNDGRKDYRDLDSDNDGILDIIEAGGVDSDGDGQVDNDTDANLNGYADVLESSPLSIPNTDSAFETANGLNLRPDYIDIDSDADGIDDTREGYSTADYAFPSLVLDSDDDGIVDFWDVSTFNNPIIPNDKDGDGTPDYQDTDSDNDGVLDNIEGNDADNDGVADVAFSGLDANSNGLDDSFDSDCAQSISTGASDWGEEDNSDGSMYLTSSDLELCDDGGTNQTVGVYFSGVPVDQGEIINSAYVQFEVDETSSAALTITIEGELNTNASSFTAAVNNVSSRARTVNSESWSPGGWTTIGDAGAAQQTVDISSIIQEIVDQGGWVNGNNIVLIFTSASGNERTAEVDPVLIINTDAIVCQSNVAHQDFDGDGEDDFRDRDDDNDGIATIAEIPDNDGSGIPDYLESNLSFCGVGFVTDTSYTSSSVSTGAISQTNSGVSSPDNALGTANGTEANVSVGDQLILNFGGTVTAGSSYTVTWSRQSASGSGSVTMTLGESADGVSFTNNPTTPSTSSKSLITSTITANTSFQYLRISSSSPGLDVDAVIASVTVIDTVFTCITDSDSDGIPDIIDIDKDNDGILDKDECFSTGEYSITGGDGGSTTTFSQSDVTYAYFDLLEVDNSVEITVNGGDLNANNILQLQANALVAGEVFLEFASDGADMSQPWLPNSNGLPRLRLFIDESGEVGLLGSRATSSTSMEAMQTRDGSSFNTINFLSGSNSFSVINPNSTGIDAIEATAYLISGCDTDNDGLPNYLDLDSDGDGIADIIEAGGEDLDNNGRADSYIDDNADGWSDIFDSNEGGTALALPDTDGDSYNDFIDIDADGDGIIDLIESQNSTASPVIPSGVDTDGDGMDDIFDLDNGGTPIIPVDTDGDGVPDYLDLNSDDDGQGDNIEAWDTDNDGVANTVATGSDSDGDGLDDAYDDVVGPNSTTNVTNNGQTSNDFPNLDEASTTELDWREITDSDGDGVPNEFDLDDDNDGILDEIERNCTSGFADVVQTDIGVTNAFRALGSYDALSAQVASGDILTLDLTDDVLEGHAIRIRIERNNNVTMLLEGSIDDVTYTNPVRYGNFGDFDFDMPTLDSLYYFTYVVGSGGARYVRFTREVGSTDVDAVSYAPQCPVVDKDGDGIDDYLDLDSDNDGIADIIEAGGVDSNNDGRVDDDTDTDENGYADTFDPNNGGTELPVADFDGDGIENYLDLDSDNDGILDNIEGQLTAGYRAPQGSDTDGDGWDDEYDADDGGTAINLSNNDGAGEPDYLDLDSDGDALPDWIEGFDDNETGDALDDLVDRATNYETAAGNPGHYINTDDADADDIPDWLEDDDADNIPNFLDPDSGFFIDTDGDGLVNLYDSDNNGNEAILPDGDADGEYDFRDIDNQISLPIELLEFNARKYANWTELSWSTLTETNNKEFEVQRLNENKNFETISIVEGAGNSNTIRDYKTYDQNPLIGENYYRLKQIDFNGEYSYSPIRNVSFSNSGSVKANFSIYPNPNNGKLLYLAIEKPDPGKYYVSIYNSIGLAVNTKVFEINEKQNSFLTEILNENELMPGAYFIRIQYNGQVNTLQLIVD